MRRLSLVAIAPIALLAACGTTEEQPTEEATPTAAPEPENLGSASLTLPGDKLAGSAQLTAEGDTVSVSVRLTGMAQGVHAAHLHMTGSCDSEGFTSAGAHLNPENRQHGTENPQGSHLGDLPNIEIDDAGRGSVTAALRGTREDVLAAIFDADGTAVVVHAEPDDYKSDPAGNAGDRIACGVLTKAS